jgi:ribosomal protein L25 (general stress protein Ctc)
VPNGSIPIKITLRDLQKLEQQGYFALGAPVRLQLHAESGEVTEYTAVIREVQRHPLQLTLLHVDFFVPAPVAAPVAEPAGVTAAN